MEEVKRNMSFKALWWIGLSVIILGASLILGNECQIEKNFEDCKGGVDFSDGTFTAIKLAITYVFGIPESATLSLGIILTVLGLILIFGKQIKEKLSPEKEKWDKPDEDA